MVMVIPSFPLVKTLTLIRIVNFRTNLSNRYNADGKKENRSDRTNAANTDK